MPPRRRAARLAGLILSCEHASAGVPARFRHVLAACQGLLRTHRGLDPGALEMARHLARRIGAPLVAQRWTRLLADANRSEHNPRLLSRWSRALPREERALADRVAAALAEVLPRLRVRRNKPYRGVDDGFLPHLRRLHRPRAYVGLEIETNQRFPRTGGQGWRRVREGLADALASAVRGN